MRLYKVQDTFYFRRKINKKSYRISLRTKKLKVALHRKKLLEAMSKEDFMFTIEMGDYKYIFEYDTKEELEEYLKLTMQTHEKAEEIRSQHFMANKAIKRAEEEPKKSNIAFKDLEVKFVAHKKKAGKVGKSTYKNYASTFNKLKEYFKNKKIEDIEIEDFEEFRDYLIEDLKLSNTTINTHFIYINVFLEYAIDYKLISENNAKPIESLLENDKKKKTNYTDTEILEILSYDYEQEYRDIFHIVIHTGMRVSEIVNLTNENIMQENGIYYFDIVKAKTSAGIRKVPIHKSILDRVLEIDFPILKDITQNSAQRAILRELYKVVDKESTKTFHTFRGTFINRAINNFPEKVIVTQEIVGHSKGKAKLTADGYGQGFDLKLKKEIVDSVSYY